jgi:Ner family transcriptional regulator
MRATNHEDDIGPHARHLATLRGADWHPADIKAELEKRGLSIRELARRLDISNVILSRALRTPSPANEVRIAAALGLAPEVIWPARYALRTARRNGLVPKTRRASARPPARAPRTKAGKA